MDIIGHIYTDFPEKFGIPRQSNIVEKLEGTIIFEPEYRHPSAFNGLSDYEYIWILFQFHQAIRSDGKFNATVKPPKLGGNTPMGVFATRSPFRPNNIGLSSVRLESIEYTEKYGPVLHVRGADMVNGTPIIDIKPYLPYTDSHPDAKAGFAGNISDYQLEVTFASDELRSTAINTIGRDKYDTLVALLSEDPRPGYSDNINNINNRNNTSKEYGVSFAGINVRFIVNNKILVVTDITN